MEESKRKAKDNKTSAWFAWAGSPLFKVFHRSSVTFDIKTAYPEAWEIQSALNYWVFLQILSGLSTVMKVSCSMDIREPGKPSAWGQVPLRLPLDIPTRITGSKSGKFAGDILQLPQQKSAKYWLEGVEMLETRANNCQVFKVQLFFPRCLYPPYCL